MSQPESQEEPTNPVAPLGVEEYIEQAHFFGLLGERRMENTPAQEVLQTAREEALATTKLPMAIDFLLSELRHAGQMSTAMEQLGHYFTPFQTYIMRESENERGRFDLRIGLEVLSLEARYRAGDYRANKAPDPSGAFSVRVRDALPEPAGVRQGADCRGGRPSIFLRFGATGFWRFAIRWGWSIWRTWFMSKVNMPGGQAGGEGKARSKMRESRPFFGEREGRIAMANRRKDPLYLFNSLHRQLGYPEPPRMKKPDPEQTLLPQLARQMEQMEKRIKLLEEEQRGGMDLSQFYEKPSG